MALVFESLEQSPLIGESFADLGQTFLQRALHNMRDCQHKGFVQAVQIEQLTQKLACAPSLSFPKFEAMLQVLLRRRQKDVVLLSETLGFDAHFVAPNLAFDGLVEALVYHYRWQQRSYLCIAWMLELQGDLLSAKAFQTCADNLNFDCGFIQTMMWRSSSVGKGSS